MRARRVLVIGGGIAGLATALNLRDLRPDIEVVVLEAGDRVGGNIWTDRVDGLTVEAGPNGYLDNVPATIELVKRLGLEGDLQQADPAAEKRYLFRGGRLHLLPTSPPAFLTSGVLSLRGRLRVLCEPFAWPKPDGVDETVFEFARRRIGREAASVLIDAMVSGVFAGNVHELSLQSTFPKMAAMEAEHRGLFRAMLAKQRAQRRARRRGEEVVAGGPAGPAGRLTSFKDGLDTLPNRLAEVLGPAVRCDTRVDRLERGSKGWQVHTSNGEVLEADAVVVAMPSPKAAPILATVPGELDETVASIPTAGLVVAALAFDCADIGGAPGGFGFLVPRSEGKRMLGCLWDSSIFPGRAPSDTALMRVMVGGAHDLEVLDFDDEQIFEIVHRELEQTMDLKAQPRWQRLYRHPLGIGQYLVGHQQLLDRMHSQLTDLPGLWLAGSSYYGVSMNACIEKAAFQAAEIDDHFGGR